nr:MAG: Transposase DDE domain-containing protein [Candidatus Kentron sp. H]VFK03902.1 MAG: Transposase DDE domain-containing protein [Candidatus Kentron sp. H]VFK04786.1 MAG: Transposase DDE domain-containing protein [Candidatus Kentron sp. H]VFK05711.1 MAG: Transposase DDE domain-containing protein [Candidatus Kentron sp. H]VFK06624.1 MAG: Transposase DDE domain-containing protein [Candidatus Kentron sp. H]
MICHVPGYERKKADINTQRQVVWIAKASNAPRYQVFVVIMLRPKQTRKFVLLPRRWVVERTFGWLNHYRRLSKSHERLTRTDEAWVFIAMSRIMLNRLA